MFGSAFVIITLDNPAPVNPKIRPEPICGAGEMESPAEPENLKRFVDSCFAPIDSAEPVKAKRDPEPIWDSAAFGSALPPRTNCPEPLWIGSTNILAFPDMEIPSVPNIDGD